MRRRNAYFIGGLAAILLIAIGGLFFNSDPSEIPKSNATPAKPVERLQRNEFFIEIDFANYSDAAVDTVELGIAIGEEGSQLVKVNELVYREGGKNVFSVSYSPTTVFYVKAYFEEKNKEPVCRYFSLKEQADTSETQHVYLALDSSAGQGNDDISLWGDQLTLYESPQQVMAAVFTRDERKALKGIYVGAPLKITADYSASVGDLLVATDEVNLRIESMFAEEIKQSSQQKQIKKAWPSWQDAAVKTGKYVAKIPAGKTGCIVFLPFYHEVRGSFQNGTFILDEDGGSVVAYSVKMADGQPDGLFQTVIY